MIGIAPGSWQNRGSGERFVARYGLSFTNLWDGSSGVWTHYGSPYTSGYWMLDSNGDRVGDAAASFSASQAQRLLDSLE